MFYLIKSGVVKAKLSTPEEVLTYKEVWMEYDEDVKIGSLHDGINFTDSTHQKALKLLLKLSSPVEPADIAEKTKLEKDMGRV